MNRLFATTATAALFALSLGGGTANADTQQDRPADLDKSIVWVAVTWDGTVTVPFTDGTTEDKHASVKSFCTGWFVSTTGDIATAGHCVTQDKELELDLVAAVIKENDYDIKASKTDWDVEIEAPKVTVGQTTSVSGGPFAGGTYLTAQLVAAQAFEDGDNALLRVADLTGTPALQIAEGTPETGEGITSIGFPGSVVAVSDFQRQSPSHKSGSVSSRQYSSHGVPSTEIDAAVSAGMSGGPTVNDVGNVIGINSFGITGESQPFNFVTDAKTLRDFLASNGVVQPATVPPAGPDTPADAGSATGQAATGQAATGQAATGQAATGQAATGQAGTGEARTRQVGLGQAGSAALPAVLGVAGFGILAGLGGMAFALKRQLNTYRRQEAAATQGPVSVA